MNRGVFKLRPGVPVILFFAMVIAFVALISASAPTGAVPNPGHPLSEIQACSDGSAGTQLLETNSSGLWNCVSPSSLSPWASSASGISYSGNSVGIGSSLYPTYNYFSFVVSNKSGDVLGVYTGNLQGGVDGASIGTPNNKPLHLSSNGIDILSVNYNSGTTGYVGINTMHPQNELNVIGDANITGNVYSNGAKVLIGGTLTSGKGCTYDSSTGKINCNTNFLTSYTETDPIWTADKVNYYNKTQVNNNFTNYYTKTQTDSNLANYYPLSNPYGYYNVTNPPPAQATIWTKNGNKIYYSSGNVGVGTTNPASTLSVGGAGVNGAGVYGVGSTYGVYGTVPGGAAGNLVGVYGVVNSPSSYAGEFVNYAGGPAIYVPSGGGKVGIGTNSPVSTLSVGGIGISGIAIYGNGSTYGVYASGSTGGVLANSTTNGNGVYASSDTNGRAIVAQIRGQSCSWGSSSGVGVYSCGRAYGVYGTSSDTGVYGNGNTYGVYGTSSGGYGGYFSSIYDADSSTQSYFICGGTSTVGRIGVCSSSKTVKHDITYLDNYSSYVSGFKALFPYDNLTLGSNQKYPYDPALQMKFNIVRAEQGSPNSNSNSTFLTEILNTPVASFVYNNDSRNRTVLGVVAETAPELLQLYDNSTSTNINLDFLSYYGFLWGGMQELAVQNIHQQVQIDNQNKTINNLEEQNQQMSQTIGEMKQELCNTNPSYSWC